MRRYSVSELSERLQIRGRSFRDEREDILYFNWSCATLDFVFRGSHLNVSLRAICGQEPEGMPGDPNAGTRPTWPWLAVFLDDMDTPIRKFEVASPNETWLLYQSPQPETHRIRLVKLTENYKSFLGVSAFTMEGEILPAAASAARTLEVIGDSITCGYGNLVKDPARHFYSQDEDGWQAYGAVAARKLGLEWNCVSISGITAVKHQGWMMPYAMEELYAYTDRVGQERLGLAPEKWDFAAHPKDYVVLNLGTNDCYAIQFAPGDELTPFPGAYRAFLEEIRRLNGPRTQIICALGSMNYYLYADIAQAVADYKKESGDERVHLLRFRPMHPFDGIGADGHPSRDTHQKMGAELAALLESLP